MNKNDGKDNFKRGLAIFTAVSLSLFVVLNIVWFVYRQIRYSPFTENVPETYGVYLTSKDGISYSVSKPTYLSFSGNLALTEEKTAEGLLIWPEFPSGCKYAAVIEARTEEENGKEIPVLVHIMIDKDGNWADDTGLYGKRERVKFEEKQEDIKEWLRLANEMWDLE